jgi:hypothetical protein
LQHLNLASLKQQQMPNIVSNIFNPDLNLGNKGKAGEHFIWMWQHVAYL